jgi:hypothetical protein
MIRSGRDGWLKALPFCRFLDMAFDFRFGTNADAVVLKKTKLKGVVAVAFRNVCH